MNRQQSVVSQHRFLILICVILIAGLGFTSVNLSSVDSISQQDLQSVEVHRNISFGKSPTTAKSAMTFEEYNYVAKTPIDRHTLPYKCGILFFYHIACTGGASINKWLIRNKEQNNVTYFTHWGRQPSVEQAFITKMNEHSESLMPNEWKVAHAHGYSFLTNTSEQYLYTWRKIVEGKGCKLIIATVLKDAVGHSISQSKGRFGQNGRYGNMTIDEYLAPLEPQNGNQRWNFLTQLDYLVYNHGPRNTYLVPKEEKVKRAMELLRRHFDIVIYQNHKKFQEIVVNITGWKMDDIPHANVYHGQLNYTQRELDKFRRLTHANGDVEFIKAVRLYYGGYLEYLVE